VKEVKLGVEKIKKVEKIEKGKKSTGTKVSAK
jgi:hypothetical protein